MRKAHEEKEDSPSVKFIKIIVSEFERVLKNKIEQSKNSTE